MIDRSISFTTWGRTRLYQKDLISCFVFVCFTHGRSALALRGKDSDLFSYQHAFAGQRMPLPSLSTL